MDSTAVLSYVATWLAVTVGIYGLFAKAGESVRADVRESVSRWLQRIGTRPGESKWPESFAVLFDVVFGEKHLTWRCFLRSCLASIWAVLVVALIIVAKGARFGLEDYGYIAAYCVALNFFSDYISLLETRYVLRLMQTTDSFFKMSAWLVLDAIVTAAVFLTMGYFGLHAIIFVVDPGPMTFVDYLGIWKDADIFRLHPENGVVGIFFYSTFFTSIWVWLYIISGAGIRATRGAVIGVVRVTSILDIEKKPFRALGFVAMLITTILFVVGGVVWLVRNPVVGNSAT